MDLGTGLGALRAAVDLSRALRDGAKAGTIKPDEFAGRVGEIYDYIADSKDALIDAKDEIQTLKEEVKELREQIAKKQRGTVHDHAAWKILEDGSEQGPYCPNCYEKNGTFIQPQRGALNDGTVYFQCMDDRTAFRVPVALCGRNTYGRT
jgi:hypothetical protein